MQMYTWFVWLKSVSEVNSGRFVKEDFAGARFSLFLRNLGCEYKKHNRL